MDSFPEHLTLCEDGVYRWSYDMDMRHNLFMLRRVMSILAACLVLVLAVIASCIHPFRITRGFLVFSLIIIAAGVLITLVVYFISFLVMHGHYHLYFEMSEKTIALVHPEKQQQTMRTLTAVASAAALVSRGAGQARRTGTMLGAADVVGTTYYSSIRRIREFRKDDVIELIEFLGINQIYVNPGDYPFVREFILTHAPEKVRRRYY